MVSSLNSHSTHPNIKYPAYSNAPKLQSQYIIKKWIQAEGSPWPQTNSNEHSLNTHQSENTLLTKQISSVGNQLYFFRIALAIGAPERFVMKF